MEKQPVQLLIVDDNLEICDILENFFALTSEVKVCGVAHDGEEALFLILRDQPDVVLLDLIMPKIDGISVLERLAGASLVRRPRIIVTSAVGQESFTSAALALGADYYMIKPYDLTALLARVCTAASSEGKSKGPAPRAAETTAALIARSVLELGIPTHMLGYQYCVAGIELLLREKRPYSIVKEVYAALAGSFDTTPECVEGAIRKAIHRAWAQEPEPMRTLTGEDSAPANGRLLTALAERIRLREQGGTE